MKTVSVLKSSVLLMVFFFTLLISHQAFATVGGPTYVSQIAYSASTSAVYYLVHDYGGRGCPPIIHALNVNSGQDREVKNCDEATSLWSQDQNDGGQNAYNEFIADTYQNLRYLGSVSLGKNKIAINVEYVSDEKFGDGNEVFRSEFEATVTQDGVVLKKIRFQGCSLDQPHVFEGYAIPGSDTMVLLLSNKGDCYEGGYVKESLYLVEGVKYYDTDQVRGYKQAVPTEPNTGNVVVFANSAVTEVVPAEDISTSSVQGELPDDGRGPLVQIVSIVVALIAGTALGYLWGKKSNPPEISAVS